MSDVSVESIRVKVGGVVLDLSIEDARRLADELASAIGPTRPALPLFVPYPYRYIPPEPVPYYTVITTTGTTIPT